MEQHDYHSSIIANVSAEEAFKRIGRVADWWANDLTGSSEKLNDVFIVRFGETMVTFKIVEASPEKIEWLVTDSYLPWLKDKTEWTGTKIIWGITPVKDATQIDMTHQGLVPEVECYENCKSGWDFYITKSLEQYLNTGIGQPNTPRVERA